MSRDAYWDHMVAFACAIWQTTPDALGVGDPAAYATFHDRLKRYHA